MANAQTEQSEGAANQAEAENTPGIEPKKEDISTSPNTATAKEQSEGAANQAEAKKARGRRLKDADSKAGKTVKAFDHNAQNRRISEILRSGKTGKDVSQLEAQIRKLKQENARLKQELESPAG